MLNNSQELLVIIIAFLLFAAAWRWIFYENIKTVKEAVKDYSDISITIK